MKKILLCVTGSIAIYKAIELVRLLVKANCQVKVVMSKHACEFIQPLTFETVSLNKVYADLFKHAEHPIEHIELARWPDQITIAPASAHSIAKIALGLADDLIGNILLATNKPILLAPAMNKYMWHNSTVQENITRLINQGVKILAPESGEQACGDLGEGRLMEPERILTEALATHLTPTVSKTVLVTAGPTIEKIDPIRYISNHSSGKMGYALAQSFVNKGWKVILISGPTQLKAPNNIHFIRIESAQQMYDAVHEHIAEVDVFISAAAVGDYCCAHIAQQKIRKNSQEDQVTLTLIKNKDILQSVSMHTLKRPFCVGFAAETNDAITHALDKLQRKQLDLIVLNQVEHSGFPFYSDQNSISVYDKDKQMLLTLKQESKFQIAEQLTHLIHTLVDKNDTKEPVGG